MHTHTLCFLFPTWLIRTMEEAAQPVPEVDVASNPDMPEESPDKSAADRKESKVETLLDRLVELNTLAESSGSALLRPRAKKKLPGPVAKKSMAADCGATPKTRGAASSSAAAVAPAKSTGSSATSPVAMPKSTGRNFHMIRSFNEGWNCCERCGRWIFQRIWFELLSLYT